MEKCIKNLDKSREIEIKTRSLKIKYKLIL